jgi:hypothetical protein
MASAVTTGAPGSATGAASVSQGGGAEGGPPSDPGGAAIAAMQASLNALDQRLERQRQVSIALGALSALESVVQALARMPGRKSLLFVSEGFVLADSRDDGLRVRARVRDVIESANRASVVIYGLDAAGLRTYGAGASESLRARSDVESFVPNAASNLREVQTGIVSGHRPDGVGDVVGRGLDHRRHLGAQPGAVVAGRQLGGAARRPRLESQPELVQRRQLGVGQERCGAVAAQGLLDDEGVGLESRQRLAHRRRRHGELPGQAVDAQLGVRTELVVDDQCLDGLVHVVGQDRVARQLTRRHRSLRTVHRLSFHSSTGSRNDRRVTP